MSKQERPRYQINGTVYRSDDLDALIKEAMRPAGERQLRIYDNHNDREIVFVAENDGTPYGMKRVFPPTFREFNELREDLKDWRGMAAFLRSDMERIRSLTSTSRIPKFGQT